MKNENGVMEHKYYQHGKDYIDSLEEKGHGFIILSAREPRDVADITDFRAETLAHCSGLTFPKCVCGVIRHMFKTEAVPFYLKGEVAKMALCEIANGLIAVGGKSDKKIARKINKILDEDIAENYGGKYI